MSDTGPRTPYSTLRFYLEDYPRTLFPLSTNKVVIENGEASVRAFIQGCKAGQNSFLPQHRVYAAKDALHLRRTVKLDPVAEYFVYDLVYTNRTRFRRPHTDNKRHYGYRFKDGFPSAPSEDYKEFKADVWTDKLVSEAFIGFDVSTYFNSLYHHDLVAWLGALNATDEDVDLFSKFLRETNSGRSIDCLPQGLYPTKMIGNDFLRFLEESMMLRASSIRRFMDDVYLFGQNQDDVIADFFYIQDLIGLKGLSVNPMKTTRTSVGSEHTEESISAVKKQLLQRRREIVAKNFYFDDDSEIDDLELTAAELAEIHSILESRDIEEEDAELILTLMSSHTEDVVGKLPDIIHRFPNLAKNVYKFCAEVEDSSGVGEVVAEALTENRGMQEYQLFWFGMMLESYLLEVPSAPSIIEKLLHHPNATDISKAKVLEIADNRFGLLELRQGFLRSGRSDWLSWSSAVGSRSVKRAARNYALE